MYYVYILEREINGDFYKGSSQDYIKRVAQHNNGESESTKSKRPWRLIFVRAFETKTDALIEEKD